LGYNLPAIWWKRIVTIHCCGGGGGTSRRGEYVFKKTSKTQQADATLKGGRGIIKTRRIFGQMGGGESKY